MEKNMILKVVLVAAILFVGMQVKAQVAINTTGAIPAASAMLDITSNSKGILIPRLTGSQIGSITPTNGLLVYSTDDNSFYYHNGTSWTKLSTGNNSSQWTTNGNNIYYSTGSVSIGSSTTNSKSLLDLTSTQKGILIPRMTASQRNAITQTIPQGLLVFQTDGASGFYYYNAGWKLLFNLSSSLISVSQGGTGVGTFGSGEILYGDGTNPLSSSSNLTYDGSSLILNGTFNHIGGSISSVSNESEGFALDGNYNIVLCDGTFSVLLPLVSENYGRNFTIKNIGTGTITIDPNGFELIEGFSTYNLTTKKSIVITCNGSAWYIIAGF